MTSQPSSLFPWLIALFSIITYSSMDVYFPAMPEIATTFHLSANAMQLTTVAWLIGGVIAVPFMGPLSDCYGRKPILMFGVAMMCCGSFIVMLSSHFIFFLLGRFCQGMVIAPLLIVSYAAINEYFSQTSAIRWMAKISALGIVSPGLGPAFGGFWVSHLGWPSLFGLLALSAFINGLLLYHYMPETLPVNARTPIHLGQTLRGYYSLVCHRRFILHLCQTFAPRFGFVTWVLASAFILIDNHQFSPVTYGWLLGATFSCMVIGNLLVGRYATPATYSRLLALARLCVVLSSVVAFVVSWWYPTLLWILLAVIGVFFVGMGINEPIMIRFSLDVVEHGMGLRTSVLSFVRMLVDLSAALAMLWFYDGSVKSVTVCLMISAVLMLILWVMHYGQLGGQQHD